MRLPQPVVQSDPILDMVGKRVVVILDGVKIRGKLISARDGFLCIEPYNGPRVSINKWEIASISLDAPKISRSPQNIKTFLEVIGPLRG